MFDFFTPTELGLVASLAVLYFLVGILFWKTRRQHSTITAEEELSKILNIQESTIGKLIQAGFKAPEHIAEISGIKFAERLRNYDIDLNMADTIYSRAQIYVQKNKRSWLRQWWVVVICTGIIAGLATFIVAEKTISPNKKINPQMVYPEIGTSVSEVERIDVLFDNLIDQTKVQVRVLNENGQNVQGAIDSWSYKLIRWKPAEIISEPGIYRVEVGDTKKGKLINTAIFYFKIV